MAGETYISGEVTLMIWLGHISNRGVFLQGLVTLWILTKNISNVLFIYLFFCPPWISSRRKVIWQLSQSPLT